MRVIAETKKQKNRFCALPDYLKLKNYNIQELTQPEEEQPVWQQMPKTDEMPADTAEGTNGVDDAGEIFNAEKAAGQQKSKHRQTTYLVDLP